LGLGEPETISAVVKMRIACSYSGQRDTRGAAFLMGVSGRFRFRLLSGVPVSWQIDRPRHGRLR